MNEYTIAFREWKTTPPAVRSAEASPFLIRDKPAILLETQLMQKSGRGRGTNAERAATRAQQRSERPGDPVVVLVPLTEDPRRLREVQSFSGVWRGQSVWPTTNPPFLQHRLPRTQRRLLFKKMQKDALAHPSCRPVEFSASPLFRQGFGTRRSRGRRHRSVSCCFQFTLFVAIPPTLLLLTVSHPTRLSRGRVVTIRLTLSLDEAVVSSMSLP